MDFSSKRVLVTAGANGIGLAIATKFKQLGAAVFVTDIDPEAVAKARVGGFHAAVSDVSDEAQVQELMATVRDELGGLDVLVNNAGIAGPTGPIQTLDSDAWKATFDVNIHGQFYCIKHALPL
jgi:NAD(P)-dependent dehydrogenase (short-subunit alcohol dehydrogenase family)